jgi:hypothetical protein
MIASHDEFNIIPGLLQKQDYIHRMLFEDGELFAKINQTKIWREQEPISYPHSHRCKEPKDLNNYNGSSCWFTAILQCIAGSTAIACYAYTMNKCFQHYDMRFLCLCKADVSSYDGSVKSLCELTNKTSKIEEKKLKAGFSALRYIGYMITDVKSTHDAKLIQEFAFTFMRYVKDDKNISVNDAAEYVPNVMKCVIECMKRVPCGDSLTTSFLENTLTTVDYTRTIGAEREGVNGTNIKNDDYNNCIRYNIPTQTVVQYDKTTGEKIVKTYDIIKKTFEYVTKSYTYARLDGVHLETYINRFYFYSVGVLTDIVRFIVDFPDMLCIDLSRGDTHNITPFFFVYNPARLTIGPSFTGRNATYKLIGRIQATPSSGHYTSEVLRDGQWFYVNGNVAVKNLQENSMSEQQTKSLKDSARIIDQMDTPTLVDMEKRYKHQTDLNTYKTKQVDFCSRFLFWERYA